MRFLEIGFEKIAMLLLLEIGRQIAGPVHGNEKTLSGFETASKPSMQRERILMFTNVYGFELRKCRL